MDPRRQRVADDLLDIAEQATATFSSLSAEQLNWKPDEKSWSVAQCLDHLITIHSMYFPVFRRLAAGGSKPAFWERASPFSGFFGRYLIKSLDPANLKKMKAPAKGQPSASQISGDIVENFFEHQHQLVEHLQSIPGDVDPAKTMITSPLLSIVTYSLDDCFSLLTVHCHRHIGQARRVAEHFKFPT